MESFLGKGARRVTIPDSESGSYNDAFLFNKHNGNLMSFKHSVGWSEEGIRIEMDFLDPGKNFEEAYLSYFDAEYDIKYAPIVYVAYGLGDRRSDWAGPIVSKIVEISLNVNSRGARVIHMVLTHGSSFLQLDVEGVSPYNPPPNLTYVAEIFVQLENVKLTANYCNEILNELMEKYIEKLVDCEGNTIVSLPPLKGANSAGVNVFDSTVAGGALSTGRSLTGGLAKHLRSAYKERVPWETQYSITKDHLKLTEQRISLYGLFQDFKKFGINVGFEGDAMKFVGIARDTARRSREEYYKKQNEVFKTKAASSKQSVEAIREAANFLEKRPSKTHLRFTLQQVLRGMDTEGEHGKGGEKGSSPLKRVERQFDSGPFGLRIIDHPPTLKVLADFGLIANPKRPAAIWGPERHIKRILQTPGKHESMTWAPGVQKVLDAGVELRKWEIAEADKYYEQSRWWIENNQRLIDKNLIPDGETNRGQVEFLMKKFGIIDKGVGKALQRTAWDTSFLPWGSSPQEELARQKTFRDILKSEAEKGHGQALKKWELQQGRGDATEGQFLHFHQSWKDLSVDIDKQSGVFKNEEFKKQMTAANYGSEEDRNNRTYSSYWDGSNPNADATMESILAGESDVFEIDKKPVPVFRMNVKNPNILDLSVTRNNMYFWFLQKTKTSPIGQGLVGQIDAATKVKEVVLNLLRNNDAKRELAKKREMYLYNRAGANWAKDREKLIRESTSIVERNSVSPEAKEKFQKLDTKTKERVIEAVFLGMEPHGMANLTLHFDDKKRRHAFDLQKQLYGEMFNFAWSVDFTTLPMFHLSKPSDLGSMTIILGRQPSILGGEDTHMGASFLDELSIDTNQRLRKRAQYYNAWFSGFYILQGYEHTISDNKIQSHFRCQKIANFETIDPETKDALDSTAERQGPPVDVGDLPPLEDYPDYVPPPTVPASPGDPGFQGPMPSAPRRREALSYIDKANQCRQTTGGWT